MIREESTRMQEKSHAGTEFQVIRPAKDLAGVITGKVQKGGRDFEKTGAKGRLFQISAGFR